MYLNGRAIRGDAGRVSHGDRYLPPPMPRNPDMSAATLRPVTGYPLALGILGPMALDPYVPTALPLPVTTDPDRFRPWARRLDFDFRGRRRRAHDDCPRASIGKRQRERDNTEAQSDSLHRLRSSVENPTDSVSSNINRTKRFCVRQASSPGT